MGLTGGFFIVIVVLTAVVFMVACVRLAPAVSGRGIRHVLARLGLVAASQVSLLAAVAVVVNSSFDFYSSWSDLLGTENGPVQVSDHYHRPERATEVLTSVSDQLKHQVPAEHGRLDPVLIHGVRTGLNAQSFIYLPPQYFKEPKLRFPAVLVLSADPHAMIRDLDPHTAPAVYVVTGPPPGSCTDVPGGPQAESFLAQDVPDAVRGAYRINGGWGVLGDQVGGLCAAKLALRHSDLFLAAVSAATAYDLPYGDLYGRSAAIRNENDVRWRLQHRTPPPVDLLLTDNSQSRQLAGLARPPLRVELTRETWAHDLPVLLRRLTPGGRP
ncbi:MAG: putative esterase [Actinomycetia bacterium]|nr:putative esterase [Actinomycetes bacterium]